jgi:hypothetical protein
VVGNDPKDVWGIGSGTVDGKPLVVFTAGAAESGETYGHTAPTPTVNPAQVKFGGGWSDGWFMVLDLSGAGGDAGKRITPNVTPRRLTVEAYAERVDSKNPPKKPQEGDVFQFSPDHPKYVSVEAEFRDAKGQYWPSFAYGKPQSGSITVRNGQPEGSFVVSCDAWTQPFGSQSRRVLGQQVEAVKGGPKLTFEVKSIASGTVETFQTTDEKGKKNELAATTHSAVAKLQIGSHSVDIRPKILFSYDAKGRDGAVVGVRGTALITLKGAELGLKGPLSQVDVDVRIGFQGMGGK